MRSHGIFPPRLSIFGEYFERTLERAETCKRFSSLSATKQKKTCSAENLFLMLCGDVTLSLRMNEACCGQKQHERAREMKEKNAVDNYQRVNNETENEKRKKIVNLFLQTKQLAQRSFVDRWFNEARKEAR